MIDFVKHPGLDRKGRVINVRANYFEISYLPYTNIYHYDIIITPEVPPSLNRRIYCELKTATFDITLLIDITPLGESFLCSFNIKVRKVTEFNIKIFRKFFEGKFSSSSMNILSEVWQKYYQSIKPTSKKLMVNLDISALKNIKIRVTHLGSVSKRLFKIVKLTNTLASGTKLEIDDTYFPLEVCEVVKEQSHFCKLNERQTADMLKLTCTQPQVCANKILQGSEILNHQNNKHLR
ncbi:13780_t:CDS:2 [Funneliformis geosporum]|uniref:13780_t:CDS:1 n=1 Tax=Funneliformis geosporum TaxID=1117311 RepID=A0A9W4T0G8_9GLOM|nr:13780_t:CDS:2 [Funneliformis geosporum]